MCVYTGLLLGFHPSIGCIYTTVAYISLNFGCERETRQTRGGWRGERETLCALPAIFSYFLLLYRLSRTVLEDGWLWLRMEGERKRRSRRRRKKKGADLFWSTERNSSARIAISLHGPLNGRAGEGARASVCRQERRLLAPPVVVSLLWSLIVFFCWFTTFFSRADEIQHESNQSFGQSSRAAREKKQKKMKDGNVVCGLPFLCVCQIHILFGIVIPLDNPPPIPPLIDLVQSVGESERETINDGIDHCCPARGESIDWYCLLCVSTIFGVFSHHHHLFCCCDRDGLTLLFCFCFLVEIILSRCWAKEIEKTIAAVWYSSWVILCVLLPYVKHGCPY